MSPTGFWCRQQDFGVVNNILVSPTWFWSGLARVKNFRGAGQKLSKKWGQNMVKKGVKNRVKNGVKNRVQKRVKRGRLDGSKVLGKAIRAAPEAPREKFLRKNDTLECLRDKVKADFFEKLHFL